MAGRRKKRGQTPYPAPTVGHPGPADWLGLNVSELKALAMDGDRGAIAELQRRKRIADPNDPNFGKKASWVAAKAKRNPYGYGGW
jgi:hypothetical protein